MSERTIHPDPYPKAYFYRRIVQAKLFIDAHFAEPLDVDAISGEAAYSKFHFIREFQAIYGRTPREHLSHCRMERAKELMAQGEQALDACIAVGYNSLSSFSRAFKKNTGSTPASFREAALERREQGRTQPLTFVPDCFSGAHGMVPE
ncbi:MAG: helix-turn-helix transcriptional regulator [Flavobacteriales bacterium]|nr:helix-turn-helix transcriptional regulator [Flavobacteriales bacterium]MBP9080919.1 helix-turn-helix transcriptional regulator [Flavobacteriales bacterium]